MSRNSRPLQSMIESFKLDGPSAEIDADPFNPEDDATSRLIDISSEYIHQNIFDQQNSAQPRLKRASEKMAMREAKIIVPKQEKSRISVIENYTQSHRIWRKKSGRLLEEEPSPVQKQQYNKNQSSFIIFQNGYLNNFNNCEHGHLAFEEGFNRVQKTRHPRNIMSIIKRKNIANLKQQINIQKQECPSPISNSRIKYKRNLSPTPRITQSCEFKKDFQSISPIKITAQEKIGSEQNIMELRCTNPNFRNKKVSNYIKMRASVMVQKVRPN